MGKARRLWVTVHLWLGLVAGVLIVVTGLTGSVLAFGDDIDAWINASIRVVRAPPGRPARLGVDALFEAARKTAPEGAQFMYINFPRAHGHAVSVSYRIAGPSGEESWDLFIDPWRGAETGRRLAEREGETFSKPLIALLTDLHWRLWLGDFGVTVLGVGSILLMASVASGLWLWWPRGPKWRSALRLKLGVSAVRTIYDLHKTAGWTSAAVLVVILFSGLYMNLPGWVTPLVEVFSPAPGWPSGMKSGPARGRASITAGEAAAIGDRFFSDGELMGIGLPMAEDDVYVVRKRAPDEVTKAYPHRQLWIDRYSGAVIARNDPHSYSGGQKFLEWMYPLHSGEAFDFPGRIAVAIVGALGPALYLTGFVRWRQKRRARRSANAETR